MREAIAQFWMERGERERIVIASALIVAAIALAYAFVWLPVTRERDRLLVRVPELRAEALAMEWDSREQKKLKAAATPTVGLKAVIEATTEARKVGDAATEIVQEDSTKVRVAIASARAEQAFEWLLRVQSAPAVRLESIRVSSIGDSDRVKIEAIVVTAL